MKARTAYICQSCGYESYRWSGQCAECASWNSLVETIISKKPQTEAQKGIISKPVYLAEIAAETPKRTSSNIDEFNDVLGGGFVPGQVILMAGDPGIGKSTLLTQIAKEMKECEVLYVCGEESMTQVKIRTERMGYDAKNLMVLSETDVDVIVATVESMKTRPKLMIVDSIQTLTTQELTGIAGSVGQVRESARKISNMAKKLAIPVILVGHVTKEGAVAGPKVLEHLVDTILYLEGDSQHLYRILKTTKNRFGPVSAMGVFEMTETGMQEVKNPSKMFLSERLKKAPGSCVTVVMEGFRPILFEIQALTTPTPFGYPRRTTSGFNVNRLQLLIAILEKRCGLSLSNHDVYVNVAGGFKVTENACDLAVCLAIVSSLKDKPIKAKTVAFGECGLSGEIRKVPYGKERVKEARKLGYANIISPSKVKSIREVVSLMLKGERK